MSPLAAGSLDRRITLQSFYETQDGAGTPVKTWHDLEQSPHVWARVEHLSGREPFAAEQEYAEATTRFTIRHRSGLSVEMRIVYQGEAYDIQSIKELGRREGQEILATRVAA